MPMLGVEILMLKLNVAISTKWLSERGRSANTTVDRSGERGIGYFVSLAA